LLFGRNVFLAHCGGWSLGEVEGKVEGAIRGRGECSLSGRSVQWLAANMASCAEEASQAANVARWHWWRRVMVCVCLRCSRSLGGRACILSSTSRRA
jgi:hypothetical protein